MSFWKSPLIQGIQDGDLPEFDVNANVTIDSESLVKLGLMLILVAGVVIIFMRLAK